jgi:iron complex outermembrane receptor protein
VQYTNKPGAYHTREKSSAGSRSELLAGQFQLNYKINKIFTLNLRGYKWKGEFVYIREAPVSAINSPIKWEWGYDNGRSGIELSIKQSENSFGLQFRTKLSYSKMKVFDGTDRVIDRYSGQWKYYESNMTPIGKSRDIKSLELTLRQKLFNSKFYLNLSGRFDDYSDFGSQFSPSIATVFLPSEYSSIKFLFGRAFRAPSADEQVGHFNIKGNSELRAELINFYELTYLISKNKFEYKINGFYSNWYNGIMLTLVNGKNCSRMQNRNLGNNYSYGFETVLKYTCKDNSMNLGFSYVRSFAKNRVVDDENNFGNIEFTLYPKYSIIANFKHKIKVLRLCLRLNNTVYLNWTDMDPTTETKVESLKPYWRTDMVFTRENSKYRLSIHFRNLFNRKNYMPSVVGSLERRNGLEQIGFNVMLSAEMKIGK